MGEWQRCRDCDGTGRFFTLTQDESMIELKCNRCKGTGSDSTLRQSLTRKSRSTKHTKPKKKALFDIKQWLKEALQTIQKELKKAKKVRDVSDHRVTSSRLRGCREVFEDAIRLERDVVIYQKVVDILTALSIVINHGAARLIK